MTNKFELDRNDKREKKRSVCFILKSH